LFYAQIVPDRNDERQWRIQDLVLGYTYSLNLIKFKPIIAYDTSKKNVVT